MSFASRISTVHGSRISSWDEKISRALGKAVTSVEAEFAEEFDLLEVHDHVFDQLEFSDHFLLFLGKLGSAHDVNIDGVELVFELSEEIVFSVFEDNLCGVKSFEASSVSEKKRFSS